MKVYILKRLVIAGVTLLGMSILIFVLMRLAPGNITDMIFESAGYVDEADRRKLEAELGIDKPVIVQYTRWLGEFLSGDLGKSYRYDLPAWDVIKPRLPVTLELAFLAPLRSPELRAAYRKSLRGGLLLYGPPGCGKTFIARALAGELSARFASVAGASSGRLAFRAIGSGRSSTFTSLPSSTSFAVRWRMKIGLPRHITVMAWPSSMGARSTSVEASDSVDASGFI